MNAKYNFMHNVQCSSNTRLKSDMGKFIVYLYVMVNPDDLKGVRYSFISIMLIQICLGGIHLTHLIPDTLCTMKKGADMLLKICHIDQDPQNLLKI